MRVEKKQIEKEYYKIVLVNIQMDEYKILKGPEEEQILTRVLQDDYHSTKYEKMLQLLAWELVEKEYREDFCSIFSLKNICKEFQNGKAFIKYSYLRNIKEEKQMVHTRVYPRTIQQDKRMSK